MAKAIASLVFIVVIVAILNGAEAAGRGAVGKDDDRIYKSEEFFGLIPFCTYPFLSCIWHLIPPSQCHWYCTPPAAPNSASAPTPPVSAGALPTPPAAPYGASTPTPPAASGNAPTPPAGAVAPPTPPTVPNGGSALRPPAAISATVP